MELATYPDTVPMEYEYVPFASVKVIVLVAEPPSVPSNVVVQAVDEGRPFSLNVTAYVPGGTGVNVTDSGTAAPWTVTDPEEGFTVYPATGPTVNGYVAFGSLNVIVADVAPCSVPFSVTDHGTPEESPDSVNVTS